ncbi:hypothetical protein [Alkalibacterium sp. 20]|uniref:hypothetical protein n=1 Tax=Alkalibacterium sp. 20 TaxID=1798803 RepID=UPI0009001801|nr:hypothetical protein [Alkalibacterium sp. 20]OJF96179.1 hypothetical protein AX762_05450 [Alkalibacterium sp. 20]
MDKIVQMKIIFSIALLTTFLSVFLIYRSLNQTTEIRNNEVELERLHDYVQEKEIEITELREKVVLIATENTETSTEPIENNKEQKEITEGANETNTQAIALIKTFIEKEYNYNTDTYISRLEDIKTYMSQEAYESLHGQYKLDELEVDIKSTLKSIQIFESMDNKKSFIALAESSYETDGNTIDLGQDVFILNVESQDGNPLITSATIPTSIE